MIHGKDRAEHDKNLRGLLDICKKLGIKLNRDKLELRMNEITSMGHKITNEGLKVDPEQIRAINYMNPPYKVAELRRFLGLVNYVAKFVPKATKVMQSLHNLLKKEVKWMWATTQQEAFEKFKDMVTNSPVLGFYELQLELMLEVDG